jgi:hypothetical protein
VKEILTHDRRLDGQPIDVFAEGVDRKIAAFSMRALETMVHEARYVFGLSFRAQGVRIVRARIGMRHLGPCEYIGIEMSSEPTLWTFPKLIATPAIGLQIAIENYSSATQEIFELVWWTQGLPERLRGPYHLDGDFDPAGQLSGGCLPPLIHDLRGDEDDPRVLRCIHCGKESRGG